MRDAANRELCGDALFKIKPKVTAEDRKEAMREFKISYSTLTRYLNGKVKRLTLGITLLNFFKRRMKLRVNRLKTALKK